MQELEQDDDDDNDEDEDAIDPALAAAAAIAVRGQHPPKLATVFLASLSHRTARLALGELDCRCTVRGGGR
jgi:hypothetical protein